MKKILGLDIGTNSIGGALINIPDNFVDYGKEGNIEWLGSRIIPMDGDYLQKFESGSAVETKAAFRRIKRGSRRLKHRYKLRRTRLIQLFKVVGWLNEEFPDNFKKKMRDDENFKFSISEFLPFSEQTIEEATRELGVVNKKNNLALSEDWIIYYLRKKALEKEITLQELARILYMMNQRRGFKSSRKDLKEGDIKEIKWVEILKIKSVELESSEKNKKGNYKYLVTPYSDKVKSWTEERKKKPEWEEKEFTFLITEKTDDNGKITQLKPQIPKPDDWALCTTAQDNKMGEKHPGEYFFNGLKENKNGFKIRQYAVYRAKYKKELEAIWNKQLELNDELRKINSDKSILQRLAEVLYPVQVRAKMAKLNEFLSNDLLHIISDDIIYYQRELKSQKNSIGECQYEKKKGIDGVIYGLKCAPKSSPDFQEFRIWQDIHNIKVFEKEKKIDGYTRIDVDVSTHFINTKVKEELFNKFDTSKEITQENVFRILNNNSEEKISDKTHRINMFFKADKKLSGNETKFYFRKAFNKCGFETEGEFLLNDRVKFYKLWHILYSISTSDAEKSIKGIASALGNPKNQLDLPPEVIIMLSNSPDIEKQKKYASYSTKAIRKLLPLMRVGKYWHEKDIADGVKEKANNINERLEAIVFNERKIKDIADDDIQKQLLKSFIKTENLTQGLSTYQACYLVYDRHSEKTNDKTYTNIDELDIAKLIPNNSLRNPIVEQVVRETLYLVKDVWRKYGQPDEIHVELGRELKKNAEEKEKITKNQNNSFEEKQRIKKLLSELLNDNFEEYDSYGNKVTTSFAVKPNPDSPKDIDKFRIWKSCSNVKDDEFDKLFKDGKKEIIPSKADIKKYVLWLSQGCCSPYTGKVINLSKLFDKTEYEIEHIIPQSKFANDSFNNLVIAEAAINPYPYKGSMLARNFINHFGGSNGKEIEISGKKYFILGETEYENRCKDTFKFQKGKLKNLLATEVPEDFVSRQLNDTRYITRKVTELLSPIPKDKTGIIFTGGSITSELKKKWGLTKEWKKLLLPRFERLEEINKKEYILQNKFDANDIDINVPENPELELKRIDHRHHALDALIIAATTREHIRYLNSLNAVDSDEELKIVQRTLVKGKIREFKTPWEKFTEEARNKLEETIVSFKTNNKVVSKPNNRTTYWKLDTDGSWKKEIKQQKENPKWMAVRKSMFKEPQGIIFIKEIEIKSFRTPKEMMDIVKLQMYRMEVQNTPRQKNTSYIYDSETREIVKNIIELSGGNIEAIEKYLKKFKPISSNGDKIHTVRIAVFNEYAAKRVTLDKSFDHKKIDKIPYAKIRKSVIGRLLHDHLTEYELFEKKKVILEKKNIEDLTSDEKEFLDKPIPEPFSGEGLEALTRKAGRPITKVTIAEQKSSESKFGNQYVEIDAGSNAFFIIYENIITKEREDYKSLATHKAIERLVKGDSLVEEREGFKPIILSPNDLVYLPTKDEILKIKNNIQVEEAINWHDKREIFKRTYKMVSCTGGKCEFIPHNISNSNPIIPDIELGSSNKNQRAWDGKVELIKSDKKEKPIREDSGTMIKEVCIKLKIDRLGNIKPA